MSSNVQATRRGGALRQWILSHDDKWMFIVPYILLAVLLSVILSLFWLVVVVAVHYALEWIKQTYMAQERGESVGIGTLIKRTTWELKLDIVLVLFALALALYMEMVLGVVGLGAAARGTAMAGVRVGTRAGVIQQVLRAFLLSVDDLAQIARVVASRRRGESADDDDDADDFGDGRIVPTKWDYAILGFGALCIGLIIGAPLITDMSVAEVLAQIGEELAPFPAPDDLFDID